MATAISIRRSPSLLLSRLRVFCSTGVRVLFNVLLNLDLTVKCERFLKSGEEMTLARGKRAMHLLQGQEGALRRPRHT